MLHRTFKVYLWIAPFLAIFVGQLRGLAGAGALLAGYAAFVALTAAVVYKTGAAKAREGRVREHPAFLPGVLLLAGTLALLLGASVTGEPTASRPGDFLLNTTAILLGTLILVSGFVVLFVRLWEAGERVLPALGVSGLLVGAAPWLANLVFRYAVVASGAAGAQAGVEDRAWVANEYLRGLQGEPTWMELLLVWTDMTQLAFVMLAYLATAAFAVASVKAGWLGKVGGSVFAGLSLALALVETVAIILAGGGSTVAAWTVFVLTVPFMVFVLPYFVGVVLIGRGGRAGASSEPEPAVLDRVTATR